MKFTFEDTQLIKDESGMPVLDENGTPKFTNKKYHFLRTLKTEEMFRDDLGAEMNAQLAEVLQTIMDVESDERDLEALKRMTSLENIDAIHQVLKYMYAEKKDDSLVQNEQTRENYEKLDLHEKSVISQYFRRI